MKFQDFKKLTPEEREAFWKAAQEAYKAKVVNRSND